MSERCGLMPGRLPVALLGWHGLGDGNTRLTVLRDACRRRTQCVTSLWRLSMLHSSGSQSSGSGKGCFLCLHPPECRAHQRVASEIQLALSKGGHSLEVHSWQPQFDSAHRTFRTFFDKLQQGNIPKLEYDNAMIAFESSPEGCRAIRDALDRKGFTLHVMLN